MLEKHGIACDMMHGFNWDQWTTGKPAERLALLPAISLQEPENSNFLKIALVFNNS